MSIWANSGGAFTITITHVSDDTIKTPSVKHFTVDGEVFACVYSSRNDIALVTTFCEPDMLQISEYIVVRIHSSCANSDILDSFDCDCRSQLLRSIDILRKRKGVLIHLFQEGRGAGIFAKYLGMHAMRAKSLSTYEAYNALGFELDKRSYALPIEILRDLGIDKVALLSNNPKKVSALSDAGVAVVSESLFGEITTENFSYLLSKFTEGGHRIESLFPDSDEYFYCRTGASVGPFRKAWIIDGDDTLWEDNIVYIRIADEFIAHCLAHAVDDSAEEIRKLLDDTEEQTILEYGFGAHGFQRALEIVYDLLVSRGSKIPRPHDLFESVVPTLSSQPESLVDDAVAVLSDLRKRGEGLILYTQGPLGIQCKKIARSGLAEYFHAICVVKQKSDAWLARLQHDFVPGSDEFVAVGNSLSSDIEPAIRNGLKAIHFDNPNSWPLQNRSDLDQSTYSRVDSLSELLRM